MTNEQIKALLQTKYLPWLAANGIEQTPLIEEQKEFVPVVGFSPAMEITWPKSNGNRMTQAGAVIASYVSLGAAGETAMHGEFVQLSGFIRGTLDPPKLSWPDWLNPPVPHPVMGPIGAEIPDAIVAVQAGLHPGLIDASRRYFYCNAQPSDRAVLQSNGKTYVAVEISPFITWLMLV